MPDVFYICWQKKDHNGNLYGDVHWSKPIKESPAEPGRPSYWDRRYIAECEVAQKNKDHPSIHHWCDTINDK